MSNEGRAPRGASSPTPQRADGADQLPARFVVSLAIGTALNPINSSMLATALVPINHAFPDTPALAAWLIAALYLSAAISQPVLGRIADLFGPRLTLMLGYTLLASGGLLAAFPLGAEGLIVARILIGIGTSAGFPCAVAAIDRSGRGRATSGAMVVLTVASTIAGALGPMVGGLLVETVGWRWVFLINLPLAFAGVATALAWLPRDRAPKGLKLGRMDPLGVVLFAIGLMLSMRFVTSLPASSDTLAGTLAAITLALFVVVELRRSDPFLDLRMIKRNPALTLNYLRNFACSIVLYSAYYALPQWLQTAKAMTPVASGAIMLPIVVCSMLAALVVDKSAAGIPLKLTVSTVLLSGFAALAMIDAQSSVVAIVGVTIAIGFGTGAVAMINQLSLVHDAPTGSKGAAAGLYRTVQYCGAILSAALAGSILVPTASDQALRWLAVVILPIATALAVMVLFWSRRTQRQDMADASGYPVCETDNKHFSEDK